MNYFNLKLRGWDIFICNIYTFVKAFSQNLFYLKHKFQIIVLFIFLLAISIIKNLKYNFQVDFVLIIQF